MKSLRDKILDHKNPIIFYELLPPSNGESANLDAYIECAIDLLTSTPMVIDAVNIPEIREEERDASGRTQVFVPKVDPGVFATMLVKAMYNRIDVILNHCTVYEPWDAQKLWVDSTIRQHKIGVLILVGGSTSEIIYPGPSVLEMGKYIQTHYQQELVCGGITIPGRRCRNQELDEPYRLYVKGLNGINFFTSQIIYDPVSVKLLLRDYAQICRERGVEPKRIILSFAPVSTKKDMEFLRWLGVDIPKTEEQELFKTDIGIGWRSTKIVEKILQDILNFMVGENIEVPLGLNIEHITRHNFELSLELVERLGKLYYNYIEDSSRNR